MSGGSDPDAWLGLLKWSLAHQDGTAPSEARPMSDEDRAWLEKVVAEGVRDDFKVMTGIYSRLCAYLDHAATAPAPTVATAGTEPLPPIGGGTSAGSPSPEPTLAAGVAAAGAAGAPALPIGGARQSAALSTFVAASTPPVTAAAAAAAVGASAGGDGGGEGVAVAEEEMVEGVMNDLEELQEIVEQIDMAATFAKIGGFGRLIALVTPPGKPEKLRLLASSVIATLTKNNPPAQASFASSGGHRALLQAGIAATVAEATPTPTTTTTSTTTTTGNTSDPSPSPASVEQELASIALRRAILHALSSSVMGLAEGEGALCSEPGFQEFLARALSQEGERGRVIREGGEEAEGRLAGESSRLRSKAAFVLKALVSSPEATRERVEALWPAVKGLLVGLEALIEREAGVGEDDDPAASLETCIEALVAAGRSLDGDRVVRELGPRVSNVIATRRQALVEARQGGGAASREGDAESAEFELGLWSEWENLTGPPQ